MTGRSQGIRVTALGELRAHDVFEVTPKLVAKQHVCVVTLFTEDVLDGWGHSVAELNANWALGHGYRFLMFRRMLVSESVFFGWSWPQALLLVLRERRKECQWVFMLDGDAAVNRAELSLQPLMEQYFRMPNSSRGDHEQQDAPHILMSCHGPGSTGNCDSCHCARASQAGNKKCPVMWPHSRFARTASLFGGAFVEMKRLNQRCAPNGGVILVRNDAANTSLDIVDFWATFGRGRCTYRTADSGQRCLLLLKARYPRSVDVVSFNVMNTPIGYDVDNEVAMRRRRPTLLPQEESDVRSRLPAQEAEATLEKMRRSPWIVEPFGNRSWAGIASDTRARCFRSTAFVCHAYGYRSNALRGAMFEELWQRNIPKLRQLLADRGEVVVKIGPASSSRY